jgi:hypothetical protein
MRELEGPRCHLALTSGRINIRTTFHDMLGVRRTGLVAAVPCVCMRVSLFAKRYQRAVGFLSFM